MSKHEIDIEGLPEGWRPVAYRKPYPGEHIFNNGHIKVAPIGMVGCWLIVEKIQPRRIDLIDENALNKAGWSVVSKYSEIVGEGMGGRLFNNLKPLLRIGITEYLRLLEVKETDLSLTKDDDKLSLSVDECKRIYKWMDGTGFHFDKISECIKAKS